MNFSVVVTVLNEASSIVPLLNSLKSQELPPGEVIVIDAGSSDGTVERIQAWHQKHKQFPLQLVVKPGVNRSEGRNIGIQQAAFEYIAITDAGCVAHPDWLREFKTCFEQHGMQTVAGFYKGDDSSSLARVFSVFLGVQPENLHSTTFLPSSRSIAFTTSAWKKAGGYPEELETCEDLVFASRLKNLTSMAVCKEALVTWQLPDNFGEYFWQVAGYATGDILAGYWPHVRRIITVFWRYVFFLWVPWLFVLYLAYPLLKHRRHLKNFDAFLFTMVTQVVTDLAVMSGALRGILRSQLTLRIPLSLRR